MKYVNRLPILSCVCFALAAARVQAAAVVTAEFVPPPGLTSGFSTGAGMGIDPPAPDPFDNRLAQTFVAAVAGRPATASLIAIRPSTTNAPLWVDIVTMSGGQVASVLASGNVSPDAVTTEFEVNPFELNVTVPLTATDELTVGQEYAMVLRSATPDANYRVFGTDGVDYSSGNAFRSQNSPIFKSMLFGADLFFRVTVEPVPEPRVAVILRFAAVGGGFLIRICGRPGKDGLARPVEIIETGRGRLKHITER